MRHRTTIMQVWEAKPTHRCGEDAMVRELMLPGERAGRIIAVVYYDTSPEQTSQRAALFATAPLMQKLLLDIAEGEYDLSDTHERYALATEIDSVLRLVDRTQP